MASLTARLQALATTIGGQIKILTAGKLDKSGGRVTGTLFLDKALRGDGGIIAASITSKDITKSKIGGLYTLVNPTLAKGYPTDSSYACFLSITGIDVDSDTNIGQYALQLYSDYFTDNDIYIRNTSFDYNDRADKGWKKIFHTGNFDPVNQSLLKTLSAFPPVPDWINRTTPYGPFTVNLGNLPGSCLPGGGTVAAFAAIQGLIDIQTPGQNNLSTFAAGVSGIARARTSNPSPCGIFGGAIANTPDDVTAQVFGGNFVATNQRDFNPNTTSGVKRAEVYCIENDIEIHPADDGSIPIINARGTWTVGNSRVQPTGEFTAHLVGPAGILRSPKIKFKKAFRSQEGAAEIALECCQSEITGQSGSQPIRFTVTKADGTPQYSSIQADATGGLFFRSESYFVLTNNVGSTLHSWNNLGYFPGLDNVQDIGTSSFKFRNLYIGNSPIVGSDARLKTLRGDGSFSDVELDAWGDCRPTLYRMKSAIAEKGEGAARIHSGYIAQQIIEAFDNHGLDAFDYGLVCEEGILVEVETPGWGVFPQKRYIAVTINTDDGKTAPIQRYREEIDEVTGEPLFDMVEGPTIVKSMEYTGETQLSVRYDEAQVFTDAYDRRHARLVDERLAQLEATSKFKP